MRSAPPVCAYSFPLWELQLNQQTNNKAILVEIMSFKANFKVWVPAPSSHNSVTLGKFLLWVPSSVRQLSWGLQEVLSDGHNVWQIVSSEFVSAICSFLSDDRSSEKVNTSFMGVGREDEPKYLRRCVLEPKATAHQEKPLIQILLLWMSQVTRLRD